MLRQQPSALLHCQIWCLSNSCNNTSQVLVVFRSRDMLKSLEETNCRTTFLSLKAVSSDVVFGSECHNKRYMGVKVYLCSMNAEALTSVGVHFL